jgi:tRNA threonylcarbamoyladenosine biosynthesis protein TsaE
MNRLWALETRSPEETLEVGRRLGREARAGDVVALVGELGSGKTHLAKGMAEGLGAARAREVVSPTFLLCREYLDGRIPFYHFDAYRLRGAPDLEAIGSDEVLGGDGACAVERADRVAAALPAYRLEVALEVTGERTRHLAFAAHGQRAERLLAALRQG